jgi:hypothetical protein
MTIPITLDTVICRSDTLIHTELEEETVMLDVQKGDYYKLNVVGSRVWKLAETPIAVSQLLEQLTAEYAVDQKRCQAEVHNFLEKMIELGVMHLQSQK